MKDKLSFVNSRILAIHKQGLHRKTTPSLTRGSEIIIRGRRLINACSNDYLGIAPSVGSQRTGKIQSSSRLLSGSDEAIHKLESVIAKTKPFDASLVFPTGYMANIGAVTTLAGKGDCILSDSLNHASIIDACRLSGAKITVYGHNDMDDLEKKCKKSKGIREDIHRFLTEGSLPRLAWMVTSLMRIAYEIQARLPTNMLP